MLLKNSMLLGDNSDNASFQQLYGEVMKTIIAGCRHITTDSIVEEAVRESGFDITEVIEGGQRTRAGSRIVGGVDWLARLWALRNNVPVKTMNADWDLYGKSAGPRRNAQMAEYGEALIAIWDGQSRGTRDMIKAAERRKLKVFTYLVTS